MRSFFVFIFFSLFSYNLSSQDKVLLSGSVKNVNQESLVGINIYLTSNKNVGTTSDYEGNYSLEVSGGLPIKLTFSGIGYETTHITIEEYGKINKDIILNESVVFGDEVIVSASLFEQNILTSPVSIEKLDILDIEHSSAANFYDELYKIKGVDMIVQSLSMRFPNSRGFNGNTNYRINQLIDGVNNSSPGLSFSPGNIFGLTQLDIESIELLVGASSALYGPGGMNGTLLMTSKNPFDYQGLSLSLQGGIMHLNNDYDNKISPMNDVSFRYGKKVNEKFAFKLTGGYLKADDWNANDYRNKRNLDDNASNRWTDSSYDGVNVYGDEISINMEDIEDQIAVGFAENLGYVEGTSEYQQSIDMIKVIIPNQDLTRTGFKERDLVSYNAENIKLGTSLHYRINNSLESIFQLSYAKGTSVYSALREFVPSGIR